MNETMNYDKGVHSTAPSTLVIMTMYVEQPGYTTSVNTDIISI